MSCQLALLGNSTCLHLYASSKTLALRFEHPRFLTTVLLLAALPCRRASPNDASEQQQLSRRRTCITSAMGRRHTTIPSRTSQAAHALNNKIWRAEELGFIIHLEAILRFHDRIHALALACLHAIPFCRVAQFIHHHMLLHSPAFMLSLSAWLRGSISKLADAGEQVFLFWTASMLVETCVIPLL